MPSTGDRRDPFPAFRFRVFFGPWSGGFTDCTGLGLEVEVQEYAEGGVNDFVHKLPTRVKQGNVTLKRGVVDSLLWSWCASVLPGRVLRLNGTIVVEDAAALPAIVWEILNAYPVKIQGPDLNAGQSSVAVETLEVCHQGILRIL